MEMTFTHGVGKRGTQHHVFPAAGCRLVEAPEVAQHSVDLAQSSALLHRVIQVTHSFQPLL